MPVQEFIGRSVRILRRKCRQRLAMMLVVLPPILEFRSDLLTDLYFEIFGDGHISQIKQGVQIRPQQESVFDQVRSVGREWSDVSRLQNRQCLFARDRAPSLR